MNLQISLPSLSINTAVLVGRPNNSEVRPSGEQYHLVGEFALRVLSFQSDWIHIDDPDRPAVVRNEGKSWTAVNLPMQVFSFASKPIDVTPSGRAAPRLLCCIASLSVLPGQGISEALLSLDDVCIALVEGAPMPCAEGARAQHSLLYYPKGTDAGPVIESEQLSGSRWRQSIRVGKWLLEDDGVAMVVCSGPKRLIRLNRHATASLDIPSGVQMCFRLNQGINSAKRDGIVSILDQRTRGGLGIAVPKSTGLALPQVGAGATGINAKRLDVGSDWAQASDFQINETMRMTFSHAAGAMGMATAYAELAAPQERLAFFLPMGTATEAVPAPQFVYRDTTVDDPNTASGAKETLEDRFTGLRLFGLCSTAGSAPRLDANLIRITLPNGAAVRLEAGTRDIVLPNSVDQPANFYLVPKPNPRLPGRPRMLEFAVGPMTLRCGTGSAVSPLSVDTGRASGQVALNAPVLFAPPLGFAASDPQPAGLAPSELLQQQFYPRSGSVVLDLTPEGVFPTRRGEWLQDFAPYGGSFPLADQPGTTVVLAGPAGSSLEPVNVPSVPIGWIVTYEKIHDGEKEKLLERVAYAGIGAAIVYASVAAFRGVRWPFELLDERNGIKIEFDRLDQRKVVARNNGVDDIQIIVVDSSDAEPVNLKGFIDSNFPSPKPKSAFALWPFHLSLGLLLWEAAPNTLQRRYAPQIAARRRTGNRRCVIAWDNSRRTGMPPGPDGLDLAKSGEKPDETWSRLGREEPALWPRASGRLGARLDPSDPLWRGWFFRDLPMKFDVGLDPDKLEKEFPALGRLFNQVDQHLMLIYGWRDETGPTWKADLGPRDPDELMPEAWRSTLSVALVGFEVSGAAGKIVRASGTLRVTFPRIVDDANAPLSVDASYALDLEGPKALHFIEAVVSGHKVATHSIPGFQEIEVKRLFTDLATARFDLLMRPQPPLAEALPFLTAERPVEARLTVAMSGKPMVALDIMLPSVVETKLFGKWSYTIQGMGVDFDAAEVVLRIQGRVNLGLANTLSLGTTILLRRRNESSDWTLDVTLDKLAGQIDLSGFSLAGELEWGGSAAGPLTPDKLANDGQQRDFYGFLRLGGNDGFLAHSDSTEPGVLFAVKVGASGGTAYWVGAAISNKPLRFVAATLEKPVLVMARNADIGDLLRKGLTDLSAGPLQKLRPGDDVSTDQWIATWSSAPGLGTVIAGSGYLVFKENVAAAKQEEKYLTSLVIGQGGRIRVDASFHVLDSLPVAAALAVDLPNSTLAASVTLPELRVPPGDNAEIVVAPGQMGLLVKYGTPKHFRMSVGWPPVDPKDPFGRDWSKSTRVTVKEFFPINTFWGGWLIEWTEGLSLTVGYALRAGWTWQYSIGGDLARASADVTIAVGGVMILTFVDTDRFAPEAEMAATGVEALLSAQPEGFNNAATAVLLDAAEALSAFVERFDQLQFCVRAELFADANGHGRGEILGIELVSISIDGRIRFHVCGDNNRLIRRAAARYSFAFALKIGCDEIRVEGHMDVVLAGGECAGPCSGLLPPGFAPMSIAA